MDIEPSPLDVGFGEVLHAVLYRGTDVMTKNGVGDETQISDRKCSCEARASFNDGPRIAAAEASDRPEGAHSHFIIVQL
jgi:hypothetical protein